MTKTEQCMRLLLVLLWFSIFLINKIIHVWYVCSLPLFFYCFIKFLDKYKCLIVDISTFHLNWLKKIPSLQFEIFMSNETFPSLYHVFAFNCELSSTFYFFNICRVTNRSPNPDRIGYGPDKPNTINL